MLGWGDRDLGYLPLGDVAGAHSPLIGMTHPLEHNGTLMEASLKVFTGRVGGRIQTDQEEMRHGYGAAASWTTWAPARPLSGCFDLCSAILVVRWDASFASCDSLLSSDNSQTDRSDFICVACYLPFPLFFHFTFVSSFSSRVAPVFP